MSLSVIVETINFNDFIKDACEVSDIFAEYVKKNKAVIYCISEANNNIFKRRLIFLILRDLFLKKDYQ